MKSAITDDVQSSRKLYHEEENHSSITEYIGASNNLIGVVEDKMTIFDVNPAEQHNKVYYGELINSVFKNRHEMDKLMTYLKQFATPQPKSFFRTSFYDSMTTTSNEGIVNYVNELKKKGVDALYPSKRIENEGTRVKRDTLYKNYQTWCEEAGETPDKRSKFCERLPKLNRNITFKRFKDGGVNDYGFFFKDGFESPKKNIK
ncbi:unnamed protein product [Phytophthora fragariaefolia]|uniref:Unnamed protein product n=1 Tax=Phytophthora fragariaefolia TaxID=1490495 RepID=A0A9W6YFC8_9STRA|nr:unnamed protein product [Phytophthora fragariaefolia]